MLCWLMWLIFSNDNVLVEAEVVELAVGDDARSHGLRQVAIAPMVVTMRSIALALLGATRLRAQLRAST
eukprot:1069596-Amphidinium_carterae.1